MTIKPVFGDSENWQPIGSQVGVLRQNADGTDIPISPLIFPLIIHQNTIAIHCSHQPVQPSSWNYAGKASMTIKTGITVGGLQDASIGTQKLFFGRINVCVFPNLASDYGLIFYVPKWFKQIQYDVWGYVGPGNPDLQTKLDKIDERLSLVHGDLITLQNDFDAYTGI